MSAEANNREPLRGAVIGVRGMGKNHARILSKLPEYELVAICDINGEVAKPLAEELGVPWCADSAVLYRDYRPDVVCIATNNASHAALTLQAAEAGVRGIYCEKPMATSFGDGRRMVAACKEKGIALAVNHQRRVGAELRKARELIASGALGEIREIRAACAGDFLTDGTHMVDSVLFLLGDEVPASVFAAMHRDLGGKRWENHEVHPQPGYRQGHPVESGAIALLEFSNGVRAELFCGDMRGRTAYQNYEITGSKGRLWRVGDQIQPNLFIEDADGGDFEMQFDRTRWHYAPVDVKAESRKGTWRPVPFGPDNGVRPMEKAIQLFADSVHTGAAHPMDGTKGLLDLEVVMAIYESARLNRKIALPLQQDRFPLELAIEEGRFGG